MVPYDFSGPAGTASCRQGIEFRDHWPPGAGGSKIGCRAPGGWTRGGQGWEEAIQAGIGVRQIVNINQPVAVAVLSAWQI